MKKAYLTERSHGPANPQRVGRYACNTLTGFAQLPQGDAGRIVAARVITAADNVAGLWL